MTDRLSIRIHKRLALSVTVLTLAIAPSLAAADGDYGLWKKAAANPPNNAAVFPVQSNPFGMSYSEWSARWWQWAFSLPMDKSPLFGANCGNGQSDHVWFLPGAIVDGATPSSYCTLDAGTALFVAVINAECSNLEGNGTTDGQLRSCADSIGSLIDPNSLTASLDHEPLTDLFRYLVESPLFIFGPLPDDNLITTFCMTETCPASPPAPRGARGVSVGTGIYLMLHPLSVGEHLLQFHAEIPGAIIVNTTYHLTVRP